ncbi:DNA-binding response regulator [Bacillus thuringiensis]|uniref:response regulator transcription factor n=1 Tax=Bacillus TaxID=1386 RepID=UPI000BEDA1F7|nr:MULTISPECIES: response regulator transcription factor [Bacillus]PEF26432.1 DNA-binding response regulator [Bacillus thuringiensis]PET93620.1 DNA-binding response regulator [Bacillus thuringiensis]PEU87016.1 DNA-binding response regulator [Bacillus sp. AFS012607]PEY51277.1 DNA-binding response regulator [Bacillus thuringiensis]PFA36587.1 DNA-binding response regulator [Bacillus thuringiensis]
MSKTILIVEDEDILSEILKDYFLNEQYQVLEERDGWSVFPRICKMSQFPIIMLAACVDEDDTLLGFELGADDYVTKSYSLPILLVRAKRLLASRVVTSKSLSNDNDTISIHGIYVYFPSRIITIDGIDINLTHTEFEILTYFMQDQGIVLSREQLIFRILGYELAGGDWTVNSHIRNLRNKLGHKAKYITTVVRIGYKFVGDI